MSAAPHPIAEKMTLSFVLNANRKETHEKTKTKIDMIFAIAPPSRKASRLPISPIAPVGSLSNELDDTSDMPDTNFARETITTSAPINESKANSAIRAFRAFLCAELLIIGLKSIVNLQ